MNELEAMAAESTHPEQIVSSATVQSALEKVAMGLGALAQAVETLPLKHLDEALHHAALQIQDISWEVQTLYRAELKKALHAKQQS